MRVNPLSDANGVIDIPIEIIGFKKLRAGILGNEYGVILPDDVLVFCRAELSIVLHRFIDESISFWRRKSGVIDERGNFFSHTRLVAQPADQCVAKGEVEDDSDGQHEKAIDQKSRKPFR